jgi:hydroxyacylglutathione hydrolase
MLFRRFYDDNLAQASYMIACEKSREAIVIDPGADVGMYTRAAGADRVRIAHVTETHIHADFLSGAHALAVAAGAMLHLSGEGDGDFAYTTEALAKANILRDGDRIEFGRVKVRAQHTPGHTPEHLTFLVSDLERGEEPVGAATGDFVFVGDVGRPDLLEKAAGRSGTMHNSARQLFNSVKAFRTQPDHLQIWPGHGAGSACGKSLGAMPQSTLGYEKLFNWAFADLSEDEFVEKVLADQPVPPRYFAVMKRINRTAAALPKTAPPKILGVRELEDSLRKKGMVVDTRPAERFARGHVPGTVNIPLGKSFLNWMGAFVPEDEDFGLITDADTDDAIKAILHDLCKIGLTRVRAIFRSDVTQEWKSRGGALDTLAQIDPAGLAATSQNGRARIIDVRSPEEWSKGHLPEAIHIPLAALPARLAELDDSAPIVLHCQGGGRSSIAAAFLQANGLSNVANLAGGYDAWTTQGLPITNGPPERVASRTPKKK